MPAVKARYGQSPCELRVCVAAGAMNRNDLARRSISLRSGLPVSHAPNDMPEHSEWRIRDPPSRRKPQSSLILATLACTSRSKPTPQGTRVELQHGPPQASQNNVLLDAIHRAGLRFSQFAVALDALL